MGAGNDMAVSTGTDVLTLAEGVGISVTDGDSSVGIASVARLVGLAGSGIGDANVQALRIRSKPIAPKYLTQIALLINPG